MAKQGPIDSFVDSVKGAVNATRMRRMTPEQRRVFEDKVIAKRKKKAKQLTPEQALNRGVQARSADAALDLRSGVDPRASLKRRMEEVDG